MSCGQRRPRIGVGRRPHVRAEDSIERALREVVGEVRKDRNGYAQHCLEGLPLRVPRCHEPLEITPLVPVIPVRFAKDQRAFNFFSTVTVIGTPQDVTLQELRIECFFPADTPTAEAARQLCASP